MRRVLGVLVIAALAPATAYAAGLTSATSSYDFGRQVMMSVFGETNDADASRLASYGDRSSESPLRELAFAIPNRTAPTDASTAFGSGVASVPGFTQPSAARTAYAAVFDGRQLLPSDSTFVASTTTLPPVVDVPPPDHDATTLSTTASAPAQPLAAPVGGAPPAFALGPVASTVLPLSAHVGRLQFDANGTQNQTANPQLDLSDDAYGAAANFDLRAGERHFNVDVNSSYEHLMRDDTTAYSSSPLSTSWQIAGNSAQTVPNYADVNKLAVGANLAVPVTHTLTLNLNYNAQRLLGAYGLPGLTNLNALDNSYGGNLTFAIPRWSSEVSVSALQYRYQDFVVPANTFSDTRANVNLTVKF